MSHNHYFRDVSGLEKIDVYRLLELFDVTCPVAQHVIKKALAAGKRDHKTTCRDWIDIYDSAKRKLEMLVEDEARDPVPSINQAIEWEEEAGEEVHGEEAVNSDLPCGLTWDDAPEWATVLLGDDGWGWKKEKDALAWAEKFESQAQYKNAHYARYGQLDLRKGHCWKVIATRPTKPDPYSGQGGVMTRCQDCDPNDCPCVMA